MVYKFERRHLAWDYYQNASRDRWTKLEEKNGLQSNLKGADSCNQSKWLVDALTPEPRAEYTATQSGS